MSSCKPGIKMFGGVEKSRRGHGGGLSLSPGQPCTDPRGRNRTQAALCGEFSLASAACRAVLEQPRDESLPWPQPHLCVFSGAAGPPQPLRKAETCGTCRDNRSELCLLPPGP